MYILSTRSFIIQILILFLTLFTFYYFLLLSVNNRSEIISRIYESPDLLDNLEFDCEDRNFTFQSASIEEEILNSEEKCGKVSELFKFNRKPLSKEEEDYPLAYGILAYKDVTQLLFMLSAFYQPQNVYCIAYPKNANANFRKILNSLRKCWPNVYPMERPTVEWGGFEIIESVYDCLAFLANLQNDWRYFQYLSGVDVPLKTNLEMVRIFKAMAEAPNFEITYYQKERLKGRNMSDSPLPLWKSSLSSLIPRKTAMSLTSSDIPRRLLEFLRPTAIADESFWASLLGNGKIFNISGAIDAHEFTEQKKKINNSTDEYYISRYQVWGGSNCAGKWKAGSCVFGVGDLARLRSAPHLVAHKMYLDFQPAAYFCILKDLRYRSHRKSSNISAPFYSTLPQVELSTGKSYSNLTHLNWL